MVMRAGLLLRLRVGYYDMYVLLWPPLTRPAERRHRPARQRAGRPVHGLTITVHGTGGARRPAPACLLPHTPLTRSPRAPRIGGRIWQRAGAGVLRCVRGGGARPRWQARSGA
eukprot:scaffold4554_cov202-Prasinococcus_capsulatus_cf.AAC.1